MKQIVLDDRTLYDLECILGGYFSPLKTFMSYLDWKSVCRNLHLSTGEFFPLPINLAVNKDHNNSLHFSAQIRYKF